MGAEQICPFAESAVRKKAAESPKKFRRAAGDLHDLVAVNCRGVRVSPEGEVQCFAEVKVYRLRVEREKGRGIVAKVDCIVDCQRSDIQKKFTLQI